MKKIKQVIVIFLSLVMLLTAAPLGGFVGLELPKLTASAETYGTYGELTYSDNGTSIRITGCDPSVTSVEIPSRINGRHVIEICYDAFVNCNSLQSITIPDTVSYIGSFRACTSLEEIVVSNTNERFSSVDGVLFNKDQTQLIHYPSARPATEYVIPNTVTDFGYDAFVNCSLLKSLTIPDTVSYIYSLRACTSLEEIVVSNTNERFSSVDGVLFNKDQTQLIHYPSARPATEYAIPNTVTYINEMAFYDCSLLQSLTISDALGFASIEDYGSFLFYNNSLSEIHVYDTNETYCSIDGVLFSKDKTTLVYYPPKRPDVEYIIPDTVTNISRYAFHYCSYLQVMEIATAEVLFSYDYFDIDSIPLAAINVDSNNNKLSSIDGVLFNKDQTKLIYYPPFKPATEYTIPDSVTSIGNNAFYNCSSLESITIPDSVTSIGNNAFYNCSSLESITIPDSVTSIDYGVFNNCTLLESITIPDSVTKIYDNSFDNTAYKDNEANWVNGVLYIGNHLIEAKTDISGDYTIKSDTKTIAHSAFSGCSSLSSITIPDSVTSIGDEAFSGCSSLSSITIPDSVTIIGECAFAFCSLLERITISDSVMKIGYEAFLDTAYYNDESNWQNKELYIDNHLIQVKEDIEGDYIIRSGTKTIAGRAFIGCEQLQSVEIPNSVTYISYASFANCSALENVEIPNSVTYISFASFANCSALENVEIPNSVTYIEDLSFAFCSALESIVIPESVTKINYYAFSECEALTDVYIYNGDCAIVEEFPELGGEIPPFFTQQITIYSYAGGRVEEFANSYNVNFVALPPRPHTHTFGEWSIDTPASYTANGERIRICTGCGEAESEAIPMLVAGNVETNEHTGISIKYDNSVYSDDIQLNISEVTEGVAFELVNGDNGNGHHKSKIFDITTAVNGENVQPSGKVLVGIPVPQGFNERKVVIYYVSDDGTRLEKLDSYVENGMIWFETDHFSYYAVVDESAQENDNSPLQIILNILRAVFDFVISLLELLGVNR